MRTDFRPAKPAFVDFETRSQAELTTASKYAQHPSTMPMCAVVKVDGVVHRIGGSSIDGAGKELLARIAAEHTLVAHNAPFDAAVWEHSLKLPPAVWCDTLPMARAAGFPGKLDQLAKALGQRGKDPRGKQLVQLLCILRDKRGRVRPPVAPGPVYRLLLEYCARDVEELEGVFTRVRDFGEPDVMALDRRINDVGLPVDAEYLRQLLGLYDRNAKLLGAEFARLTGGVNPSSPKQVKEWMQRMGFRLPQLDGRDSIGKFALKAFVADPHSYYIGDGDEDAVTEALLAAIEARKEVVRVGRGKAERAAEALESDGRVREQFVYYGAHTGRWSGRGLQLHNMPKQGFDVKGLEPRYEDAVALAEEASRKLGEKVLIADVLNAMLRSIVRADNLLVADYGAVEARGVAWVAGERRMLELFSDPAQSVYLDMGEKLFGRRISKKTDLQEYTMAKTLVLGCGYGMSGMKFAYTCKSRGISTEVFARAGMEVSAAVKSYRETYPAIPAVWKEFGDAVLGCVEDGEEQWAGRCSFRMAGLDLHMVLPSGRPIVYRNARVEMQVPAWQKLFNAPERAVKTVCYDSPRGWRNSLYGSKVCENAVQAICRDLLADAMLRCEQAGLNPILHVHDELVCSAPPDKLELFMQIMSTGPKWARGFPILAEGYSGPVWCKIARGYKECSMMDGKEVH